MQPLGPYRDLARLLATQPMRGHSPRLGAAAEERARTEAWVSAYHLAEERKRLGLTQKQVAEQMGVTPGWAGFPPR